MDKGIEEVRLSKRLTSEEKAERSEEVVPLRDNRVEKMFVNIIWAWRELREE